MKKYISIVELFYFVYIIIENVHLNKFKYEYNMLGLLVGGKISSV